MEVVEIKRAKLGKVVLELNYDEAIWLTALMGAVHSSSDAGPWNFTMFYKLHNIPELSGADYQDMHKQIKAKCRLQDLPAPKPAEPEKWEFRFAYNGSDWNTSAWCDVREQDIDWSGMTRSKITKVSFRRAKS